MDNELQELKRRVDSLEKLLKMKILGNDTSTNYGLPAQTVLYGLQQAGQLSLSKNGVTTSINNDTDPDLGETVSLESVDNTVPHGDKLAIAPNALFILAWDGATYQVIAFITDGGSGAGNLTLSDVASSNQILADATIPQLQVTDGVSTSAITPSGIIVNNGIGIDAVVPAVFTSLTFTKGILTGFTP